MSTGWCSMMVVVVVRETVLGFAVDVDVVVVNDVLVLVTMPGVVGRERQFCAELTNEHVKPLFGAPLQGNSRS